MNEPTLEQRLERLERENRRLKRAWLAALAVIVALVLVGTGPSPPEPTKVIEAEKLVLRDTVGTIRAVLGPGELGGLYHLTLFDMNGKELVGLGTALDQAVLLFNDSHRKTRAEIRVLHGTPTLTLYDETGKSRAWLGIAPDGSAALRLYAPDGITRGVMRVGANAVPALGLLERDGKVIWSAPWEEKGVRSLLMI